MLPFSFEWVWDMTHMVFHGGLHFALTVLSIGMAYCIIKAMVQTIKGGGEDHGDH